MCENDPLCLFWKEPSLPAASTFRAKELAIKRQRLVRWATFIGTPILFVVIRTIMAEDTSLGIYLLIVVIGLALGAVVFLNEHWTDGMFEGVELDHRGVARTFSGGTLTARDFWPWDSIAYSRIDRVPDQKQGMRLLTLIGPKDAELVRLAIADHIEEKEIQEIYDEYGQQLKVSDGWGN